MRNITNSDYPEWMPIGELQEDKGGNLAAWCNSSSGSVVPENLFTGDKYPRDPCFRQTNMCPFIRFNPDPATRKINYTACAPLGIRYFICE